MKIFRKIGGSVRRSISCRCKPLLLFKQYITFAEAREVCERPDDVSEATDRYSAVHFQRTKSRPTGNPHKSNHKSPVKRIPQQETKPVNRCFSCYEFQLGSPYGSKNAVRYSCGKAVHIWKVF